MTLFILTKYYEVRLLRGVHYPATVVPTSRSHKYEILILLFRRLGSWCLEHKNWSNRSKNPVESLLDSQNSIQTRIWAPEDPGSAYTQDPQVTTTLQRIG